MRLTPLTLSVSLFVLPLLPHWLQGQAITFEPTTTIALGHTPEPVAVGDLNGDNHLDVVIASSSASGGPDGDSVSVLLGSGDGTFQALGEFAVGGSRPEGVILAFIDEDPILDVVTANYGGNSVSVLLGSGTGALGTPIVTPVAGGPRFVVAWDFDGDDKLDLATANYNSDSISILKGDESGNFSITSSRGVGNGPEVIALAHLTPDANIDLVTADALGNTITPLRGNGTGGFTRGAFYSLDTNANPRFVLVADLDGDGLDDLIVANNDLHTVTLERNLGNLNFVFEESLSFDDGFISLRRPIYVDLADMDQDGNDDILITWTDDTADEGPDLFSIFPGTGTPFTYEEPLAFATGRTPLGVAAADFNSDGKQDVLVANAESDTASVYLSTAANPGVVVDNSTDDTTEIGFWSDSIASFPFGASSRKSTNTGARHTWEHDLTPAEYEVQIRWTVADNRSSQVPVEVEHAAGRTQTVVDQTEGVGVWHSLGTFDFDDVGTVTLTVPAGFTASADAVRFRPTAGPADPGDVPVIARSRPADFRIDENTVLAFQGNLTHQNSNDSENWVEAVFSAVGVGSESERISALRLFIDSNGDRSFDTGDRQLGSFESFTTDTQPLTFDGFSETLADQTSTDFFVIAELSSTGVATTSRPGASATPALAAGSGAFLLLMLLFARRGKSPLLKASYPLLVLLALVVLPVPGCGGGEGGGGSATPTNLQLELTSLSTVGSTSGVACTPSGLPVTGWNF